MPWRCEAGHEAAESMKFCPECGARVTDPGAAVTCRNGHEVEPAHKFCPACGVSLAGGQEAQYSDTASHLSYRPRPDSELTPDELAARKAEHAAAVRLGSELPDVTYLTAPPPSGVQGTVIHFLVDGFSVFGTVWFRGQEAEVWPGHPRWPEMQRLLQEDTTHQFKRYGKQMFGLGPWPGEHSYAAGAGQFQPLKALSGEGVVSQPTDEELARADEAERRRGRRVPMPLGVL